MPAIDLSRMRKGRPERLRITLWDDDDGMPLYLPPRAGMRAVGAVIAVFFAIFAGVLALTIVKASGHTVRDVSDLMGVLFEVFWILGWSVGVVFLGLLTFLLLFYGESARITGGRLVYVPRLGPLKFICEYDLARIRNLRLEAATASVKIVRKDRESEANTADKVKVRFDYGGGTISIGDAMDRADGELLVEQIRDSAPSAITQSAQEVVQPEPDITPTALPAPLPTAKPRSLWSPSSLALIAANLVPVAGVMMNAWDLATVAVLFWAESAIVGFYTLLKMAVVGKLAVLFAGPFFVGHFGGFMAMHFLFVYEMFVRGLDARGPGPPVREALTALFVPLWPALCALFISHGVSFVANFILRREYEGETVSALMMAPYKRIFVMHVTIIFGGWIVLALKTPAPALVMLIALKIWTDLYAHRREHGERAAGAAAAAAN